MFDTYVCVVGWVLNPPEKRRTTHTNAIVVSFRVGVYARRWDRQSQQWIDGDRLYVKVNCWRRLAEGVLSSVIKGDPVVVYGRIRTRTWVDEKGVAQTRLEMEASSVGHDLAHGTGEFRRVPKEDGGTNGTVDTIASVVARKRREAESRLGEDPTDADEPKYSDESRYGDGPEFDEDPSFGDDGRPGDDLGYGESYPADVHSTDLDAISILREAGFEANGRDPESDEEDSGEEELSGAAASGSGGTTSRGRRRVRQPVPA